MYKRENTDKTGKVGTIGYLRHLAALTIMEDIKMRIDNARKRGGGLGIDVPETPTTL